MMSLIYVAVFYVAVGLVVARINAKHKGEKFEFDEIDKMSKMEWIQILKWPVELF